MLCYPFLGQQRYHVKFSTQIKSIYMHIYENFNFRVTTNFSLKFPVSDHTSSRNCHLCWGPGLMLLLLWHRQYFLPEQVFGRQLPWQVCVGNHDRLFPGIVHSVWTEGWYGNNLQHEMYIVRLPPEWVQTRDMVWMAPILGHTNVISFRSLREVQTCWGWHCNSASFRRTTGWPWHKLRDSAPHRSKAE